MKVPIQFLLPYPADEHNPHDALSQDTLCTTCETGGNVKNVDPRNMGDVPTDEAPETGRSFLWSFPELERNHRCPLCRLVWKAFQPFYEQLRETGLPNAVLGHHGGGKDDEPKWIRILSMVFRMTMDNRDTMKSGQVESWASLKQGQAAADVLAKYIYEDERIPHFNIAQLVGTSPHAKVAENGRRRSRILENDKIDFAMVKNWITACETDHGRKCNGHKTEIVPAKRLIDVETSCIVEPAAVDRYMALSYVWGQAAQFMLSKDVVDDASKEGFFDALGSKITRTIRDAMDVCRKIGVRHLWVDALCIIQDDAQDKAHQIGLMDEIYGRALAVLIVAAGDGAESGIPGMGEKSRELVFYTETVSDEKLMASLASTTLSAKRSKWNTRAWTYQEYIMGTRLLVFTDTYVFFKCPTAMFRDDSVVPASGIMPATPVQSDDQWISLSLDDIPEDMDPKKIWKDYYDSLLSIYLRREMTFDSDALPAFSGVLKVLSKALGSFHHGLPKNHFGRSLLWGASHRGIFQRRADFPSWSWAGWHWTFDYFNADRSNVGVYGYDMPKETVPIQFFTFDPDGKLELFFAEEQEPIPKNEPKASTIGGVDDLMTMMMSWNAQLNSDPNFSDAELDAKCNKMVADMYAEKQQEDRERSMANPDEDMARLLSHFDPPDDHLDLDVKD